MGGVVLCVLALSLTRWRNRLTVRGSYAQIVELQSQYRESRRPKAVHVES